MWILHRVDHPIKIAKLFHIVCVSLCLHISCASQYISPDYDKWNLDVSGAFGRPILFNETNDSFGQLSIDAGYHLNESFSLQLNLAYAPDVQGVDFHIATLNARWSYGIIYSEYGLGLLNETFGVQGRNDIQLIGTIETGAALQIGKNLFIEPFIEVLIPSFFLIPELGVSLSFKF